MGWKTTDVLFWCAEKLNFFSFFKVESKDRVAALFFPLSFSSGAERLARPRLSSSSSTPMIFGSVASQPCSLNPPARVSRLWKAQLVSGPVSGK